MDDRGDKQPRDTEIALLDAIKTLAEVVMFAHPGSEKYLTRAFEYQARAKLQSGQPEAAALFELLRQFVAAADRQSNREAVRKFLEEPPQGRA